jgi:hypothetical protein
MPGSAMMSSPPKTDLKSAAKISQVNKMEFVINHTRRQIRKLTNVSELDTEAFVTENGWHADDDAEIAVVYDDNNGVFERMVSLVENENYDIADEYRDMFVFNEKMISDAYDAQPVDEEPYDKFMGWDNPGASFDW